MFDRTFIARFATVALTLGSFAACDAPYEGDGLAIDPDAPVVKITSPERGTFTGGTETVIVTGTATDDVGVTSVEVNGIPATIDAAGNFTAVVPVGPGTKLLHAIAKDADGNAGKETRAVVVGELSTLDRMIPSGVTAAMNAATFDAISRGASSFLSTADLTGMLNPASPLLDIGGGPDCLYAQAFITNVDIESADIKLQPQPGGIWIDATITKPRIDMNAKYAVSCADGSRDIMGGAGKVRVQGLFAVGIDESGRFDISLKNPDVTIDNLMVDVGGLPQDVIDMLDLDQRLGPILAWATERFVVPLLNKSLAGVSDTKTLDLLGKPIDMVVLPRRAEFDVTGMLLEVDTKMRAQNDSAAPGFVFIDNAIPSLDLTRGFEVAVADDAANQMLTSFWGAKGLEFGIDLANGSYGEIGKLYDRVEIKALVPPFVDASDEKALQLTLGDLIIDFKNGDQLATSVAVNAYIAVSVGPGADGALRLDVGQPTVHVDILEEGVEGANTLSSTQFEEITSFALSRVVAVGAGSVGAIPMPAAGGVGVQDLTIGQQAGYLVVTGSIR